MKFLLSFALMFTLAACSTADQKKTTSAAPLPVSLTDAVKPDFRTAANMQRDMYRHPLETLTFFGVTPSMTVVEIWPSGGWYTEILAPYLAAQGKYIIADPEADPKGYTNPRKEWLAKHPIIASKVSATTFQPPKEIELAPAGSVDMVLTFRNIHNWLPTKSQEQAFKTFFKALKPGGILGVVEHRANTKIKFNPESGYVLEKEVIRMAKKAGFILQEKSEINANPNDKANYPDGVWTLPPRLKLGEKNKAEYLAIGESDRMTLKFVKPIK
jgi:predicted methyltransferase